MGQRKPKRGYVKISDEKKRRLIFNLFKSTKPYTIKQAAL